MGIQDFDTIFDILDPSRRGVLNAEQLRQFDENLHFNPLDHTQVCFLAKAIFLSLSEYN